MSEKNILLTTMSTLPNEPKENTYCAEVDGQVKYCKGIGQLEAGTKYFLSKVRIDKIVVIGTKATEDGSHVYDDNASAGIRKCDETTSKNAERISADKFYVEQILKFVKEAQGEAHPNDFMKPIESNRDLKEDHFLVLKDVAPPTDKIEGIKEVDNVQGIVNAILEYAKDDDIHLYIDMQGGGRTSGYVRNAVLSILGNERESKVTLEEIIATEYGANNKENRIVNETKRYKIMDLAAAMNSFVRYGKVDLLKSYCEDRGVKAGDETALGKLLRCMESVDDSISLCNVKELENAISDMKQLLNNDTFNTYNKEDSADQVFVKSVFDILRDGIKRDYGALLDEEDSDKQTLEMIAWCTRKGFLQQALTLVEDKMPKVFLKKEQDVKNDEYVLKYKETNTNSNYTVQNNLNEFGKLIGHDYYDEENNLFYNLEKYLRMGWNFCIYKRIFERVCTTGPKAFDSGNTVNKNNTITALEDILKLNGMDFTDDSVKDSFILSDEELSEIVDGILHKDSHQFIDAYSKFHICNNERENKEIIYIDAKTIYYKIRQCGYEFNQKPFLTLVHNIGNYKRYSVKNNSVAVRIDVIIKPEYKSKKRELDDLFILHDALKKERNCANHAAEEGIRLPASVVKRALEIYVEEAREFVK